MTITKTIKIDVDADQATKDVDKFNDEIEETNESTEQLGGSLDTMTGGAIAGFGKMLGSIKKVILGFKSLKVAIAATGIGLLIIAIASVSAAFKGSEEGQNKFIKLMAKIGVVTGNVMDVLADLGEAILSAGKALVRLAKGDLKGASAAWSEFKDNIKETTESIKNFRKETAKEINQAAEVADMRAKADKIDRKLLVERARLESEIADLRLKGRESDKFTAEERVAFLKESERLADILLAQEQEALKLRFEAQKLENTFSRSNKENLDKEAQAEAALFNIQTRRLTEQKSLIRELDRVRNELAAQDKARMVEAQKLQDEETKDAELRIDLEIEREQKKADRLLEIEIEANRKSTDENQKKADEANELGQTEQNATIGYATQTSNLVGQIVNEDSKAAKGVAIASATISGIESVQNAFTTANKSPITAINPAYPFIQAGIAGAFSLLQLAKIKKSDPTGKSSSGGGSTGGGGGASPSFNLVAGTGTNQITEGLKNDIAPVKAFVVSSDVSTSQELDRKIVEGASL